MGAAVDTAPEGIMDQVTEPEGRRTPARSPLNWFKRMYLSLGTVSFQSMLYPL